VTLIVIGAVVQFVATSIKASSSKLALDVEFIDPASSQAHLLLCLAYTGKDDAVGRNSGKRFSAPLNDIGPAPSSPAS
jgi:hypothetical protein